MSNIFHSGSGVKFESVRFQDLESIGLDKDSCFVPRFPVHQGEMKKNDDSEVAPSSSINKESALEKNMDLEAIRKEAYLNGKIDGRLEAEEKLHSAVRALESGLEQISCMRQALIVKSKEDMIKLIMGVARQVVHAEIEEKEDIVVNTVTRVLEAAIQADTYYIRVHPEDLKIVTDKKPLFLAAMKGLQHIYFIADETVSRGGCLAESQVGEVDATIESQLNEIYNHLSKEIL